MSSITTISDHIARALVALSIALVPACGRPPPNWSRVELADAGEIIALTPVPTGLLVGRYAFTAPTRSSIQSVHRRHHIVRRPPAGRGP